MTRPKGYTGLSDAADRHIRELVRMGWSPENARKMVEPVARAEHNRAITAIRTRWSRRQDQRLSHMTDVASVFAEVAALLDEYEASVQGVTANEQAPA